MILEILSFMLHNIRMRILIILPFLLLFLSACIPTTTKDEDIQTSAEIKQKEAEIGVAPDNPFEDITAEDDDLYESTGGLYLNQQEYYNHLIQKTMQIRNQQVNRILKNFIEHDVVPTAQQLNYYNISDFITETIRSNTGKRLDVEVTKTIVRDINDEKEDIVYLEEGRQVGYLPSEAKEELGW